MVVEAGMKQVGPRGEGCAQTVDSFYGIAEYQQDGIRTMHTTGKITEFPYYGGAITVGMPLFAPCGAFGKVVERSHAVDGEEWEDKLTCPGCIGLIMAWFMERAAAKDWQKTEDETNGT